VSIASKSIAYQEFETSALSQWLEAHSYEYGFILRYPKRMASSTNHAYDAHYYRFVGKKNANKIYKENSCIEEYNQKEVAE
ncbi:D-alanyl-D-alanine carboxypeptidase family protein, partial [Catenibacterium sp.]